MTCARWIATLFGLAFALPGQAQFLQEPYQSGVHYFPISPAQPAGQTGGKVEVVEVFSYACPVCATFEPQVVAWKKRAPVNAQFAYLPAAWNPTWEMVARAYYASEALGIAGKTHEPFFKALHIDHVPIAKLEDVAQWYSAYGVSAADFLAAMRSFGIETRINRSRQMLPRWQIDGTPTVVVAGKYRVTGASAGGYDKVFDVVDFLVAKEAGVARAGPG